MFKHVDNRKRQSSVAQRMLENREVRRRQPVLAGRASPLSPSLHRMEPFILPPPPDQVLVHQNPVLVEITFLLQNESTKSHSKYVAYSLLLMCAIV